MAILTVLLFSLILFANVKVKFVVSHCTYCSLWRDFGFTCSVTHLGEGEVNTNHNVTCSPVLAENDSS